MVRGDMQSHEGGATCLLGYTFVMALSSPRLSLSRSLSLSSNWIICFDRFCVVLGPLTELHILFLSIAFQHRDAPGSEQATPRQPVGDHRAWFSVGS